MAAVVHDSGDKEARANACPATQLLQRSDAHAVKAAALQAVTAAFRDFCGGMQQAAAQLKQ